MKLTKRRKYLAFGRPNMSRAEEQAVLRVLRSGWLGMGPETIAFESELAAYAGTTQAVSVNSCTSALTLALQVSGVGPGDEVIVPSLTWCSTANAAIYLGATPVFCDVDADTFNVTPATVKARLTSRTRAVVAVHMGGLAADIAGLRRALPRRVRIIEDAAHALGGRYADGQPVGASGNLVCFSFYANKNLASGDGGAIVLDDPSVAARLRSLRQQGLSADAWKRYSQPVRNLQVGIDEIGYKMNYTDLQAAIARVQLRRQAAFARTRLRIARQYLTGLARLDLGLRAQAGLDSPAHARHLFQVVLPAPWRAAERDQLVASLREINVGASIHYHPVHSFRAYRGYDSGPLPVTGQLGARVLTLPIGATMNLIDGAFVLDALEALIPANAPRRRRGPRAVAERKRQ